MQITGRKKNKPKSINSIKKNFPYLVILVSFISLSITIFLLINAINPLIKNQKLKYLCTYQLGNKKDDAYKKAKLKLDKMVGNSNKFCRNFILPESKRSRLNIFSFLKDVLLKVAF